ARGQTGAQKIMRGVLLSESRLRAPGEFSWSVFGSEDSRGGRPPAGVSADTSEAGEDVEADLERERETGAVADRISNENMDIEEDLTGANL
ncbi:MAG: hypothetical protein P1U53_14115, partial [Sulfitobacter sp.]|nr:hypothetical protein [Sulfitobacter sp.]